MKPIQASSPLTEAMARYETQSGRKFRNGSCSCRTFDRLMGTHAIELITWEMLREFVVKLKAERMKQTTIGRCVGDVKTAVHFITGMRLLPPAVNTHEDDEHGDMETISIVRWARRYCREREIVRREPIYAANRFVRHIGETRLSAITTDSLVQFRKSALAEGLSPRTVECTISDLQTLVKAATGNELKPGRRCKVPRPCPRPITAKTLEAVWPYCDSRLRQWIVISYWTALRFADAMNVMVSLTKTAPEVLEWKASKTQHLHQWPILPWLHPYVVRRKLPFKRANSYAMKSIRRAIVTVCDAAGIPHWSPKHLRQFSLSQWSRTDHMAGQVIHGCGLNGVLKHYIAPMVILEAAAPRMPVPECFTAAPQMPVRLAESELSNLFCNLNESQQLILRQTMRAMIGTNAGKDASHE